MKNVMMIIPSLVMVVLHACVNLTSSLQFQGWTVIHVLHSFLTASHVLDPLPASFAKRATQ